MNQERSQELTRRAFLRTAAGGAVAGLGMGVTEASAAGTPASGPALATGVLGRTNYPVTRICFGTGALAEKQHVRLLRLAFDYGLNMLHTSSGYTGGKSMEVIGEVFKDNPHVRARVWLALKSEANDMEEDLNKNLKVLKTDYADLLLPSLHEGDPRRLDEIRRDQEKLRKKGKIRHVGFVCHRNYNDVLPLVIEKAPEFFEAALIATAWVSGIGNKLRGFPDEQKTKKIIADLRALRKLNVGIISMKSGAQDAVQQGAKVFEPHVKYILNTTGADTVLTTISTREQLEMVRRLDLRDLQTRPAETRRAEAFLRGRAGVCRLCGNCGRACPRGLPVSDLMRVRMYHEDYGRPEFARGEFQALGLNPAALQAACGDCSACTEVCPVGLAGARTVAQVASFFA